MVAAQADPAFRAWLKSVGVESAPLTEAPVNWVELAQKVATMGPGPAPLSSPLAAPPPPPSSVSMPSAHQAFGAQASQGLALVNPAAQAALAQQTCQTITSLEDLRSALEAFEGCGLKKTATHLVFGDGNPHADTMLIGEAPGADEDAQGLPFVGMSGQVLSKALAAIGLTDRASYYITNTVPWRPPGNRQPTPEELAACRPFLEQHIHLVAPKILIAIGATAAKTLLQSTKPVAHLRGQPTLYTCPLSGRRTPVFVIYHPAYWLRSPSKKQVVWYDLLAIQSYRAAMPA